MPQPQQFLANSHTTTTFSRRLTVDLISLLSPGRLSLHSLSQSHCNWRPVSVSWCRAPSGSHDQMSVTVVSLWGDLSSERLGLSFVSQSMHVSVYSSKLLYDWQLISVPWCRAPFGTCDQILLSVVMLLSEICSLVAVGCPLWWEDGSSICSAITHHLTTNFRHLPALYSLGRTV
jgi:hypothetical protein